MTSQSTSASVRQRRGSVLDITFRISLILKGIDGIAELIGGVLLLFISPTALDAGARVVFQHELAQDPNDFIATHVLHITSGLDSSATIFGAVYLMLHGVVKVVLVWAVLREKLWAFPWMIAFLIAFMGYQAYEMVLSFSAGLLALTVFDVFVTWLTVIEYRKRRRAVHGEV